FAAALGIDPAPDRGRFMSEITRLVHENPAGRKASTIAFLQALALQQTRGTHATPPVGADPAPDALVPVPLRADVWSHAIFHRKVAREDLVAAIIADHTASLLCHGLGSLDDATLQFIAEHSSILTRLAERSAQAFGVFSDSLHVHGNRVVPP